ncbi:hypothetical protein CGRA01v4_14840 [Colletotrichum graminicola]|nr:hypothetical protein CGRA01v4_14840 [Colletotrichum graminicola]
MAEHPAFTLAGLCKSQCTETAHLTSCPCLPFARCFDNSGWRRHLRLLPHAFQAFAHCWTDSRRQLCVRRIPSEEEQGLWCRAGVG